MGDKIIGFKVPFGELCCCSTCWDYSETLFTEFRTKYVVNLGGAIESMAIFLSYHKVVPFLILNRAVVALDGDCLFVKSMFFQKVSRVDVEG